MEYEKKINYIIDVLKKGEKKEEDFKVGVEFEHIIVKEASYESISYYGRGGVEAILEELLSKGYEGIYEKNHLIGMGKNGSFVSLEPGSQLEFSTRPCVGIREIEKLYLSFVNDIVPIIEKEESLMLATGFLPKTSIDKIELIPKKRYVYMSKYFKTKGKYAHYMMKGTASLQVSIDYANEDDFIKKFKVANFLSPLFSLITDNAPIFEGEIYRKNSVRSMIWDNMDDDRCGNVAGVMSKIFGYRQYAEYILGIEPVLIEKDGRIISTGDETVESIMDNYLFNQNEIEHIMTMVFPDVRAKRFIEIRSGDSLPYPLNLAYVSLIKGIFYNEKTLDYFFALAEEVGEQDLAKLKESVLELGFDGQATGSTNMEFVSDMFELSKRGLITGEIEYLKPLEDLMLKRKNASIVSKELIEQKGLDALKWCALNTSMDEATRGK
ncbi:MAG: glutamate--cysteine ligase [Alkaliphilus sp.]|nr:glutamate--cysteine ligase [bacterium AH-315-E09]PHS36083.1 MAG: glutamate--cysteine ligase [Alkaliphilus sp.]